MTHMMFLMNQFAHNLLSDVPRVLNVLREYMLLSDNVEFIHKSLNKINVLTENELSARLRQADMRSLFQ